MKPKPEQLELALFAASLFVAVAFFMVLAEFGPCSVVLTKWAPFPGL